MPKKKTTVKIVRPFIPVRQETIDRTEPTKKFVMRVSGMSSKEYDRVYAREQRAIRRFEKAIGTPTENHRNASDELRYMFFYGQVNKTKTRKPRSTGIFNGLKNVYLPKMPAKTKSVSVREFIANSPSVPEKGRTLETTIKRNFAIYNYDKSFSSMISKNAEARKAFNDFQCGRITEKQFLEKMKKISKDIKAYHKKYGLFSGSDAPLDFSESDEFKEWESNN